MPTNRLIELGHRITQDVRYAIRGLRRTPAFAVAAILSLALGIGANTAIFSALDSLMFRPLAVAQPERLVTFEQVFADGSRQYNLSFQDYRSLAQLPFLEGTAATSWAEAFNVATADGVVDRIPSRVSVVTGNYFRVMGLHARAGRLFANSDDGDDIGSHAVVVISADYATRRFRSAESAVGKTLLINGGRFTVIGVAPPGFTGDWVGWPTDFWVPSSMITQMHPESVARPRDGFQFKVIGRLRPGVEITDAAAQARVLFQRLQLDPPPFSGIAPKSQLDVHSAATGYSPQRESFARPMQILMAIVAGVLLIACANLANLLLAKATVRSREIALRVALGATRGRIFRQLLIENLVIALVGAAFGLLCAAWAVQVLDALLKSGPMTSIASGGNPSTLALDLALNPRVFAFGVALALATCAVFGIVPALRASSVAPVSALRAGGESVTESRRGLGRSGLVVLQVAVSLILLVCSGLFVRSMSNLSRQPLGFDRTNLLLVWTLPGNTGRTSAQIAAMWDELERRISGLPGVASVSTSVEGVLGTGPQGGPLLTAVGGDPADSVRARRSATISTGYFATLGQRLVFGRDFRRTDDDSAPQVIILNQALSQRLFGSADPTGRSVQLRGFGSPVQVVGVVADTKQSLRRDKEPAVYYPVRQNLTRLSRGMCIVIRTQGDALKLVASVRRALQQAEPALPILNIDSADQQLAAQLFQERLVAALSASFAGLALVLACVGLYGLIAYVTARRTGEIGIRMAMGATQGNVVGNVVAQSLRLVVVGVCAGIIGGSMITRALGSLLYGVGEHDPLTLGIASATMILVALIAAVGPARRASRVNPVVALRANG